MVDTIEGLLVVDEAHVQVSLVFPGFLHHPPQIGYVVTCSSSSSEPSFLYWQLWDKEYLQPSLYDTQEQLAGVRNQRDRSVIPTFLFIS